MWPKKCVGTYSSSNAAARHCGKEECRGRFVCELQDGGSEFASECGSYRGLRHDRALSSPRDWRKSPIR